MSAPESPVAMIPNSGNQSNDEHETSVQRH